MIKLIQMTIRFLGFIAFFSFLAIAMIHAQAAVVQPEKKVQLKTQLTFLFVDIDDDGIHDESEFLVIVTVNDYKKTFKRKVPLNRMLRSQIKREEFIVLEHNDLLQLDKNKDSILSSADGRHLYLIYFAKVG